MHSIQYGNTTIHYQLYKQSRKDIKISVDLVNGVAVYTPDHITDKEINKTILQKANWIHDKLQNLNEIQTTVQPKEFVSGEKLPYLGRHYRLKVHQIATNKATIRLHQGKFIASVPESWTQSKVQNQLEKKLISWYRYHGLKKLLKRAAYFENLLGTKVLSIQFRTQHKRWGTCTPDGHIYINWRIAMAPVRVMDYVIVHELAHLKVPEHNQAFWRTVKSILPNYGEHKEWLRIHGRELYCISDSQ